MSISMARTSNSFPPSSSSSSFFARSRSIAKPTTVFFPSTPFHQQYCTWHVRNNLEGGKCSVEKLKESSRMAREESIRAGEVARESAMHAGWKGKALREKKAKEGATTKTIHNLGEMAKGAWRVAKETTKSFKESVAAKAGASRHRAEERLEAARREAEESKLRAKGPRREAEERRKVEEEEEEEEESGGEEDDETRTRGKMI